MIARKSCNKNESTAAMHAGTDATISMVEYSLVPGPRLYMYFSLFLSIALKLDGRQ